MSTRFGTYCHECHEFFYITLAKKDIHIDLACDHSKEHKHTCIVYKESIHNGEFVSDSGPEVVVTFLRGEKV